MIGKTNAVIGGAVVEYEQLINYAMTYDAGDECTDITGGWSFLANGNSQASYVNKTDEYIEILDSGSDSTNVISNSQIDFSGYSKLVSVVDYSGFVNTGNTVGLLAINTNAVASNPLKTAQATSNLSRGCLILDVSDINVPAYIRICGYGGSYVFSYKTRHMFLVKEDNWQEWLIKGGLTVGNYASLDAVLADTEALSTLMNNADAVNYMLKKCTGTVMASVIQSSDALSAIRNSQYNADIFANEHWCKFLRMVGETPESEKVYLYDNGDGVSYTKFNPRQGYTDYTANGVIVEATTFTINVPRATSYYRGAGYGTASKVDVSNYTKLCSRTSGCQGGVTLGISPYINTSTSDNNTASMMVTDGINKVDLSSVTGEYHVVVYTIVPSDWGGEARKATVHEIWFE